MDRPSLTETEREIISESLESPFWAILVNKIIRPLVSEELNAIMIHSRNGTSIGAAYTAGRIEGIVRALETTYTAGGQRVPENIKLLSRRA